jgi:hypothetical protein
MYDSLNDTYQQSSFSHALLQRRSRSKSPDEKPILKSRHTSKNTNDVAIHTGHNTDDDDDDNDEGNDSIGSPFDSKQRMKKSRRRKHRILIQDADAEQRRYFFAFVFFGIGVLMCITYLMANVFISWHITRACYTHAFWTTAITFGLIALVVYVPHDFMWLRDTNRGAQIIYMVVVVFFVTVLVSTYHDFIDNTYVIDIMLRIIVILCILIVYALIPWGGFSHGCNGFFVVVLMTCGIAAIVVFPHLEYFRKALQSVRHPGSLVDTADELIPSPQLLDTSIVMLGTTVAIFYILYKLYHTATHTFLHDPLFIVTQLYLAVMITLLICMTPKMSVPGIVWREHHPTSHTTGVSRVATASSSTDDHAAWFWLGWFFGSK